MNTGAPQLQLQGGYETKWISILTRVAGPMFLHPILCISTYFNN